MLPAEAIEYLKQMPEDEPAFVLRAQDEFSPSTITMWSSFVRGFGQHSSTEFREQCHKKADQALKIVKKFVEWQSKNRSRVKIPD